MIKHISPKLYHLIKENAELQSLIKYLIDQAHNLGMQGKSDIEVNVRLKKKDWLKLAFVERAYFELIIND